MNAPAPSPFAIDVRGLNKFFGRRHVVKNLSLQVRPGEIYGFLGPNGSGKTTSIRMLCGLLTPDSGSGTCLGFDIVRESNAIKRHVGYMTQRFSYWEDLSLRENLDFIARIYEVADRAAAVEQTLGDLGLAERAAQLAGSLSGGWKQRLALAAALLHKPRLLLLDEPTAGVDPKARRDFWEELHQLASRGISVLVSTHYMDEAERCHKLAYIAEGALLTRGTAAEVVAARSLTTFILRGDDLAALSRDLKALPGVDQTVAFGSSLHVTGKNATALRAALDAAQAVRVERGGTPFSMEEQPTGLEDVFIHMMKEGPPGLPVPTSGPGQEAASGPDLSAPKEAPSGELPEAGDGTEPGSRDAATPGSSPESKAGPQPARRRERAFSLMRWWGIVSKEFLQLRRDRVTFGMIIGLPIIQLLLFGYAINLDPKHLPTAVICGEQSEFSRSFIAAMRSSDYFAFTGELPNEAAGRLALEQGRVQFVLSIPTDFSRKLVRGERPALLLEADASDPAASGKAVSAVHTLVRSVAQKDLTGPLSFLHHVKEAFEVRVHNLYNPEGITHYNIIPGLMGVVLNMTMVMLTGLAMTRERERGTMENLLSTPALPLEVVSGKIIPYVFIGLLQATLILLAAYFAFSVPFAGSLGAVYTAVMLFIGASLTMGITLSSLASNQLQAMQLTFSYFLPGVMMSGFMFPFTGMPGWAQFLGNLLPITYFIRLIRAILLKGAPLWELWPHIWPILVFIVVVMGIAVKCYKKTLD